MKIRRSRKALSPVVASIILIAVTVAVSIAVAAWMGALTFSFMGSSSLTITNVSFAGNSGDITTPNTIVLTIKNTGTKQVTVGQIKVNNIIVKSMVGNPATLAYSAGGTGTITITLADATGAQSGWFNGNPYAINLYDGSGNGVGSTQQNAPGV
jgi:flagellin-like protein